MPNPRKLKIGDLVRFVTLPDEWSQPKYFVHRDCRAFMKAMIKRRFPSRVHEIDEDGLPWIKARLKHRNKIYYHSWVIMESTGWRKVTRRA